VGAVCPFARAGVGAISTQAWTNPLLGVDGLDLLEQGNSAEEALQKLLDADPDPEMRQVIAVDKEGRSAAHTGSEADPWKGHRTGDGYAVAGNMLVGEETITAMAEAFEASADEPLSERLLRALESGQAAGGDKRGRQSAALFVVKSESYPYLDLRVDEHPDPVAELRRVYEVAKRELLPFVEAMPTRDNPKGNFGEELKGRMLQKD
jgi:uncharacterized Ntn-hydrolase superfamily protein